MTTNRAPNGLKTAGKGFWHKVLEEFVLTDAHDLERLKQSCSCLDEISDAEAVVRKEGMFVKDRFQQTREHPALKTTRDNKTLFCRIIRELGLDLNVPDTSRPPRQY
jgi:P27 family predicted phage terminase small subunit